jgi:DNA-binding response OmpR family regulator
MMSASRILLLEDDEDVAELLVLVLRGAGYMVDLAVNVAQADHRLAERGYELVVADWRLPDGDGIEIANRAADLGAKTAILSGYALQMTPEKSARHEIWMKPIRPTELIAAVERCLGKPRMPATN